MNDIVSLFVVFFVFKALGGTLKSLFHGDKRNDFRRDDKELPYLPIILFHKVRTSCVLFRAQIAMALWTESVRVFEATKKYRIAASVG